MDSMEPLNCTSNDSRAAHGYSSERQLTAENTLQSIRELRGKNLHLPAVKKSIFASSALDEFAVESFKSFASVSSRQFGENTFSIIHASPPASFGIGYLVRYCGTTFSFRPDEFRAKSNGLVLAMAHTHPVYRGTAYDRVNNKAGEGFGPGDWTVLALMQVPFYLYAPSRKISVMEYDGTLVTCRRVPGLEREPWIVV